MFHVIAYTLTVFAALWLALLAFSVPWEWEWSVEAAESISEVLARTSSSEAPAEEPETLLDVDAENHQEGRRRRVCRCGDCLAAARRCRERGQKHVPRHCNGYINENS